MIPGSSRNPINKIVGKTFRDVAGEVVQNTTRGDIPNANSIMQSGKQNLMRNVEKELPPGVAPAILKAAELAKSKAKKGSKQKQKQKGKGFGPSNPNGPKRPPSSGTPTLQYGESNYMSSTSNFAGIPPERRVKPTSGLDQTYWYNILQNQDFSTEINNSRTAFTVIDIEDGKLMNFGESQILKTARTAIFLDKLTNVVNATGGNASVKNSMTNDNFWKFNSQAYCACLQLAEVYSIRAWDPPYEETNTVMRSLKNATCASTKLMEATANLEEAVSSMALPQGAIDFAMSLFQTYKKSPVSGGVHQRFISKAMLHDLSEDDADHDFQQVISNMNNLATSITDKTWSHDVATIQAFLTQKTPGFVRTNCAKTPASYPIYEAEMNAIFCNLKYEWITNGINAVSCSPTKKETLLVALPMDSNNVPKWVSGAFMLNYGSFGDNDQGYPFFGLTSYVNGSHFIGLNDTGGIYDVTFREVTFEEVEITDCNYRINFDYTKGYFKPSGLNTQLFAPSYETVQQAVRDHWYEMYSMPSMY